MRGSAVRARAGRPGRTTSGGRIRYRGVVRTYRAHQRTRQASGAVRVEVPEESDLRAVVDQLAVDLAMGRGGPARRACARRRGPRRGRCRGPARRVRRRSSTRGCRPGPRRRRPARAHAPAAGHRFPEVLLVGEPGQPRTPLLLPVPRQLVEERAAPVQACARCGRCGGPRWRGGRSSCLTSGQRTGSVRLLRRTWGVLETHRPAVPCSSWCSRSGGRGPARHSRARLGGDDRTVRRDVDRLRTLGSVALPSPAAAGPPGRLATFAVACQDAVRASPDGWQATVRCGRRPHGCTAPPVMAAGDVSAAGDIRSGPPSPRG